jgi:solute carrier family 8 (sodium/calcium exchanger)
MGKALSLKSAFDSRRISKKFFIMLGIGVIFFAIYSQSNPEVTGKEARFTLANGYCVETITTEAPCHSWIVLHGTSLYNKGVLGFFYFLFLIYLFLGIAIVADIFMGAIEVITSKEVEQVIYTDDGVSQVNKVKVWNPTIANLTLMALGSSAPEILLSVIETVQTLDQEPGELGPSTIVGSAAFNLLGKFFFF